MLKGIYARKSTSSLGKAFQTLTILSEYKTHNFRYYAHHTSRVRTCAMVSSLRPVYFQSAVHIHSAAALHLDTWPPWSLLLTLTFPYASTEKIKLGDGQTKS